LTRPSRGSPCPGLGPWVVLHAPAVPTAPSEDRRWRSVPARRSGSTPAEVQRPAAQEERALPASELVEPEALEASDPVLPAAEDGEDTAAAAGTAGAASAAAAVDADIGDECCCPTRMEPSSSSYPQSPGGLRSVLRAASTRWLKLSKRWFSSAYSM
jgi:hypothetical protein